MTTKLETGKLYTCSEYHLLVFPTEEVSVSAPTPMSASKARTAAPAIWADWWSKELKCQVSFIPAGRVFCVVENNGGSSMFNGYEYHQVHVIAGEDVLGWISVVERLNIEELAA